jgi:hypothetical protein
MLAKFQKRKLGEEILHELKEHWPFTALATLIAVIIFGFLMNRSNIGLYTESLFDIFHPAHIFFSSIVSAAIFYKYRKKMLLALAASFGIAIFMATISDVIFPYFGGIAFGIPISFHLPFIEEPIMICGVAILGSLFGIIWNKTKFPHLAHVLISVLASLLYIFAYGIVLNAFSLVLIFIIVFLAVIVPCCIGDIVLPLLLKSRIRVGKSRKSEDFLDPENRRFSRK